MLKNNAYSKNWILFSALLLVIPMFLFLDAKSETEESKYTHYKDVKSTVNGIIGSEINPKLNTLDQYFNVRTVILSQLAENNEDIRDNALTAFQGLGSAVTALGLNLLDEMDGITLKSHLDGVNTSIETFIRTEIDVGIFQRKGNQQTNTIMGYNEAFAELVTAYGALNDHYTLEANKALFGSSTATSAKVNLYQTSLYMTAPSANSVFVSRCNNPSGKCYGYYPNPDKHKKTCTLKHGTAGTTNKTWWSCFSETCTYSAQHWVKCRAQNCNVLFPPPTRRYYDNYRYRIVYHDHEKVCQEPVHSIWNGILGYQAKCGKEYFTCQGGCSHRASEGVFYNKTGFTVYETVAVRVIKGDLYMATMNINGSSVTAYPGSNGEAVLRKTFNSGDVGTHTVTVTVYYGDVNSPSSTTHTSNVSVQ